MGSWLSVLVYFWFSYNTVFLSSVNQLSLSHFMLVERQQFFGISGYVKVVTLYCHAIFWGHRGIGGGVRENNANRFLLRMNG